MKSPSPMVWQWLALLALGLGGLAAYLDLSGKLEDKAERAEVASLADTVANLPIPPPLTVDPSVSPDPDGWELPQHWRCTGRISGEALTAVVRDHTGSVLECFNDLEGPLAETREVTARILLDELGHLSEVTLDGPLGQNATVMGCVQRAFNAWPFPVPEGGDCGVITLPLVWGGADAPPTSATMDRRDAAADEP